MEKLYNLLFEAGDYTKSYEEFVEQYGDSKKSEQLYKGLNESGDYTKSFEEFKVQYEFNDSVKKKDSSEPIVQEEELVSGTEVVQPPGSSVGSEVIEEEIDIDFDETLPENQQTLLENQSNIDILNSVGFFDSNKPQMETLDAVKLLASKEKGQEKKYQIKDPETGKFSLKKESEIPENILKAIKLYEKANPKVVKKEEVLLTEEDYSNPDTINTEILIENNVDQEDYLKWEKKNTRQEGSVYKFFKTLLPTNEGNQYQLEKRQYEKLQSYNASKLNSITNKLSANEAAQSFSTDPQEIKQLKKEASLLKKDFMNTYSSLESAIESFPTYKDQTVDDDLERRKKLYNATKKGGVAEYSAGTIELMKTAGTAITSFATDFVAGIPAILDQRLVSEFGYDKKGFLAGVSESISDSGARLELEVGETKRPAFIEGKPVTFEGEEFVVDGNGTVYDSNSNIRMDGILSEEKINSIIKRSKDVPNTTINATGGSMVTGGVNTLVNLFALIRTAGKVKNATGLNKVFKPNTAGKVSMGLTSFTSGVVKNVDDIRSQLMATGMSEKEAMDIAVNAGQAISTLDGIFSGLAGSNEGLLIGFQAIKDQVKNLAIKEGKSFAKKQFKDKLSALVKENLKEVFIEEIPVYASEKAINYLVNQKIGNEVLDQKITKAGVLETVVMTIGATSTLGGSKLFKGNSRKDLVRTLSKDVKDLKKTLDVLIDEGSLSKEEAANAYSEIYNMQAAELKTKGTIKMSQNVEEAGDLLTQRQNLMSQKEGLEGPLKEEIDKRIEDVDAQIKKLQERDVAEAQSIIDGEKDGQRTVEVTREEALEALKAENEVRLKSKLPAILESEANIIKKQDELIKDKQDAIQVKKTEGVDVPESTGASETVVEGDTTGAVTNQSQKETEGQTQNQKTEVRERIDQPYLAGNTEVRFNADGTVNKILKKGTKSPAGKAAQSKAEKNVLKNKIDVNAGKRFVPETDNLTPQEYDKEVAENSTNIRQISESIKTETENSKTLSEQQKIEQLDPQNILSIDISEADFNRYGDPKLITPQIRRKWFKKPKKNETIKNDLDTVVMETPGLEVEAVIDFIVKNPNRKVDTQKGKSETLTELEKRFKELTGINPTPSNINTVVSINPDAEPLSVVEQRNKKSVLNQKEPVGNKRGSKNPKKILGDNKPKKVTVDEKVALKNQIKLEVKAAKDSKKDQTTRRKSLSDAINNLYKAGSININKVNSLIKKISGVNLNNSYAVAQVLDYVAKVNNDASAVKKLKDADNLRKRIKRQLKNKKAEGTVSTAVEAFLKIDPNLVNDIDAYNAQAKIVSEGLNKSKATKDGDVKVAGAVDINAINKFTNKAQKEQNKKLDKAAAESFRDLTGLNSNEFTLEEMRAILSEQKAGDFGSLEGDKGVKADLVKKGIKKAFSVYQGIVDAMINNKVDPFTGEPINLSSKDLNTIKEFMNIDLDLLTNKQAMEVLDAMVNFSTNPGATGGMESMIAMDKGNKGTAEALKQDLIGKPLGTVVNKWAVKSWNTFLSSLPNLTINVFGGQSRARLFDKLSGFNLIKNGAAKAEKTANDIASDYENKFIQVNKGLKGTGRGIVNIIKDQTKTMPNGERFDSASNDIERGLFAYMRRTINGTKAEQKTEFTRRKTLVEKTIVELKKADPKKSDLYQNAYDKLVKGSNNINDIDSKVDPINKEAVEYMTNEWSKLRPELENTSLNVYNRTLGKDLNYSPDSFSKIKAGETQTKLGEPVFVGTRESIYDKETGVLMEKRPGNNLPEGRFLNLGFDSNNINSLKDAITDVETAPGVQQLKGFIGHPNYEKIIPTVEDRLLMDDKFKRYINAKRGISNTDKLSENSKTFLSTINKVAGFAVSRVLGGPTQALKQLTPLVNTMTNLITDPKAVVTGMKLSANTDVNSWLNNSGFAIANRGIQSITNLNGLDNKTSQAIEGEGFGKGLKKFAGVVDTLQKSWLENFLVKPDAYAARASWMAYYVSDLKKQGIDPAGIDWKNHKPNERAGDYAQQQVDIQQNTSDQDLQGELFSSKDPGKQTLRKVAFPFANFLLNQKTRMYTNTNTLLRKGSTIEDRVAAGKSLVGLGVETATFNAIGLMVTQALAGLSFEEEEEKDKAFKNRKKGRIGNVVKDVLSPIPILDDATIGIANSVLRLFQDAQDPKDVYQLFVNDKRTLNEMLGTLGIPITKGKELRTMMEMSLYGTYKNKYSGKKTEISAEAQDKMSTQTAMYFLYLLGLAPTEVGSVVNYNVKALKKKTKKEKKYNDGRPEKTKRKKPTKSSSGPKSPFSNRRSSTMPKSPFD